MAKKWYVVQTYSQYEEKVRKQLLELIERQEMQEYFGEIIVPIEKVIEVKKNKRKDTTRKLFPGYILIEMEMNEKTWHLVNSVPRVFSFVGGSKDKPIPMSQKEVDALLKRMQEGEENPRPKTVFSVGEELRIIDGPFSDFNGIVEDVNYDKNRLKVSVFILGQPTPVELEFSNVEKLS